jgi:hypothetical protein
LGVVGEQAQLPASQKAPALQIVPQPPQWSESVCVFVSQSLALASQSSKPATHSGLPLTHS